MKLKEQLILLANKYETPSFCNDDPSQFLRWYKKDKANIEVASFIAAMLAFGSRKQFIPKISFILEGADNSAGNICAWLKKASYKKDFPTGSKKFYRFYSYDDMQIFFDEIAGIINSEESMGKFFEKRWQEVGASVHLADIISQSFPKSRLVPKGKSSANKRIHMFLRWMVRQNSPVDLGLWSWYPQAKLLIPLDVHVMQEGQKLGLISKKASPSRKTAMELTKKMNEVFPDDPARADYALFGLGVAGGTNDK